MTTSHCSKTQSYTGFVKERLDLIEGRIELGYRQEAIKEEIEKGTSHTATLEGFRGALKKARKWRDQRKKEGKDVLSIKPPQAVVRDEEFLQEKVTSSLLDPRHNISHDQVMAEAQAIIDFKKTKKLSIRDKERLEKSRAEIERTIEWVAKKINDGSIWRTENALVILDKPASILLEQKTLMGLFGFESFDDLCILGFPPHEHTIRHYGDDVLPLVNLIHSVPLVPDMIEIYLENLSVRLHFQIHHGHAWDHDHLMVAEIKKALLQQ